jgi:hypothetical protein
MSTVDGEVVLVRIAPGMLHRPVGAGWPAERPVRVLVRPDRRWRIRPYRAVLAAVRCPESRIGAALAGAAPGPADLAVLAGVDTPYRGPWLDLADVILCPWERAPCPPHRWIARVLARHPGAAAVAVLGDDGAGALGLRDGRLVSIGAAHRDNRAGGSRHDRDAAARRSNDDGVGRWLPAAVLHGWLAAGRPAEALDGAAVCIGGQAEQPSARC